MTAPDSSLSTDPRGVDPLRAVLRRIADQYVNFRLIESVTGSEDLIDRQRREFYRAIEAGMDVLEGREARS